MAWIVPWAISDHKLSSLDFARGLKIAWLTCERGRGGTQDEMGGSIPDEIVS